MTDLDSEVPRPDIRILRGDPTAAEIAAVTAVVAAALEEEADAALAPAGRSAWSWSQRQLRTPIVARDGAWRGFSG